MISDTGTRRRVKVTQLAGNIGAEISGVDTGVPLDDETLSLIRQALLDHKVVFLREQSLDYHKQVAFARRLGPLTLGHPTIAAPPGQPFLEEIDSLKGGLAQGREGQLLAHGRDVRRPAAGLHAAARRGDPRGRRRHDVG